MAGRRKTKKAIKRIEFVLNDDNPRDHAIWGVHDEKSRRGEASEWIKAILYASIVTPQPETLPATAADVRNIVERLVALEYQISAIQVVAAVPDSVTPQEMVDDPRQAARQAALSAKLKRITFAGLTQ